MLHFKQILVTCYLVSSLLFPSSFHVINALSTGRGDAAVDVVLIDAGGESPADVYGAVRASRGGSMEAILFDRSARESVKVRPGESVPLTGNVVAGLGPLTVTVDLWDHHSSWSDYLIGQGRVDFEVKVGMTQNSSVYGIYGEVQVSVTWE